MSEFIWEEQAQIEQAAREIFGRHGVDFVTARRAGGWSNATWIAGGLALRIATRQGSDKIRRETRLAALLPPEVGYPVSVECGVTGGYEWSLSREIPGRCLGDAWTELGWEERACALRGLWRKAEAVHQVGVPAVEGLARRRAWFNSIDPEEAGACLRRLAGQGLFSARQARGLRETLERFWQALPAAAPVLNHGDLTLDNAIWRGGQVVSLLDFEFAVIAPLELDLNNWLKRAFGPADLPGEETDDPAGQELLRQAALDVARPLLARPGSRELLLGYAVLIELWLMELWLAHPEGEGPVETWQPYRRLLSLSDGQGGYLKELLGSR